MNTLSIPMTNTRAPTKHHPTLKAKSRRSPSCHHKQKRWNKRNKKDHSNPSSVARSSSQPFPQRNIHIIKKRGETLLPPVTSLGRNQNQKDQLSVISEVSVYSEFDDSECRNTSDLSSSSLPPKRCLQSERSPLCSIQMLDGNQVMDDTPCWFRVFFDESSDFVELEGDEIVNFCSSLLEHDDTWIFDVTLLSSGILERLEARHVVQTLQFLLSSTTLPPVISKEAFKPRLPWQLDWIFDDEEEERKTYLSAVSWSSNPLD
jgi:hypothetical protein